MPVSMNRCEKEMELVSGGRVTLNPTPGKMDTGIDLILNGKNYDALAQWVADHLNPDIPRTRQVDNSQDIYDYRI